MDFMRFNVVVSQLIKQPDIRVHLSSWFLLDDVYSSSDQVKK